MIEVGVGQFAPTESKKENLLSIGRLVNEARRSEARLLILPEYSAYFANTLDERMVATAEPIDGPFVSAVRRIAASNEIAMVFGINECIPGERTIHNTVVYLNAVGDVAGSYRKLHPYDAFGYQESAWVTPGDAAAAPEQFLIDGVSFAAQTCFDLRFPEVTRVLVDAGADVVMVPAQWVPGPLKEDHWSVLLRARAIENTIYLAAANHSPPFGTGRSRIVDPMGVTVTGLGEQTGVAVGPVSPERTAEVRATNPSLLLRRFQVGVRPKPSRSPGRGK